LPDDPALGICKVRSSHTSPPPSVTRVVNQTHLSARWSTPSELLIPATALLQHWRRCYRTSLPRVSAGVLCCFWTTPPLPRIPTGCPCTYARLLPLWRATACLRCLTVVSMSCPCTILGNILLVEVLVMNCFMICRLVHSGDSPEAGKVGSSTLLY
jgi:hypothetical protein